MSRLISFYQITADGYFSGPNGDMSWASHRERTDEDWNEFVIGNARSGGMLLFGRVTYELMIKYWPTPAATQNDPVVAERMNNTPKIVFSKSLDTATWNNSRIVKEDMPSEVRKLKKESGKDMAILGSGSIVSQLTHERLIDEYQIVVNPIVLGKGRTMFEGIKDKIELKLTKSRTFKNGNVLLCYGP